MGLRGGLGRAGRMLRSYPGPLDCRGSGLAGGGLGAFGNLSPCWPGCFEGKVLMWARVRLLCGRGMWVRAPFSPSVLKCVVGHLQGPTAGRRKSPVLKHGPRSLPGVRVFGWQTRGRSESERGEGGGAIHARTPGRSTAGALDLSRSACGRTRKMVNYSRAG